MAEGREAFERLVLAEHEFGEAAGGYIECSCGWPAQDQWEDGEHPVVHVLDALGLTVETVWAADEPGAWDRVANSLDAGEILDPAYLPDDAKLRALGLVKKRRLIGEWEVVE